MKKLTRILGSLVLMLFFLAGCLQPARTPTQTPQSSSRTVTPEATSTPRQTSTAAVLPTAAKTPQPTATSGQPPTAAPQELPPTPTLLPEPVQPVQTGAGGLPWWNDRIFYEVFVRSFQDSDGDGIGDLQGLISRLDYLNDGDPATTDDLGVTGLWLMPVAESPSYHGYDVVDYRRVEQDYGDQEDLEQLIAEAHRRGMIVIADLVMNHTSVEHPWFQAAQQPGSEYEDWYLWVEEPAGYLSPWGSSVWHPLGNRYYYGLFWSGMPDLNYQNGDVTEEMFSISRFWLEEIGVDGFRLDAVRHLIEKGPVQENTPETHAWLQNFHRFVRTVQPDAFTVGEAWTSTEEVVKYIGDELDVAFEFDLAEAILIAVARGDSAGLVKVQAEALEIYPPGQYAAFLSNHDQKRTIERLLARPEAAKAAATLLLTNPGIPFLYYGEEVGMRGSRPPDERVRTPMQWEDSPAGGFTTGQPWHPLAEGEEDLNVADQTGDPGSLLSHYRNTIRLRQEHASLRAGEMRLIESSTPAVYSFLRHLEGEALLVVVNLSREPVDGYTLSLAASPLVAGAQPTILLGEGEPAAPEVDGEGGFQGYQPLPVLAPYSSLVLQLEP